MSCGNSLVFLGIPIPLAADSRTMKGPGNVSLEMRMWLRNL